MISRQIELDEYSCPICNDDIAATGVDFSYEKDEANQTKTTYKCLGCSEKFYSIEYATEAHSGKTPHFLCLFCGKQAKYLSLKNDWTDYWKCLPCKASFEQSYSPHYEGIQTVNMYTNIGGHLYVLRQFMEDKRARIEMLPEDPEDTVVIAYEFEFLLPNVTPANISEKIKTYLVFS